MTQAIQLTSVNPTEATNNWLEAFDAAVAVDDICSASALLVDDSHWRDLLA